jgi:hypothetical protein
MKRKMATEEERMAKAVRFYRAGIVIAVGVLLLFVWGQMQVSGDLTVLAHTPVGNIRIFDVVFCTFMVVLALFLLGTFYSGGKRIPIYRKSDAADR